MRDLTLYPQAIARHSKANTEINQGNEEVGFYFEGAPIGLGGVVGVWGGNELQAATNWRVALKIVAIVAVPLALLLYVYVPRTWFGASTHKKVESQKKLSIIDTMKDLFARADVRVACLIYAGSCGTMCGFGGMWNMQLAESWAWKESEAVFIASSFFVGIAIGSPLTGWLGGKFGSRGTLLASMWITLPAFLFWLLVPTDWPLWFDAMNVGLIGASQIYRPANRSRGNQWQCPQRNLTQ